MIADFHFPCRNKYERWLAKPREESREENGPSAAGTGTAE
jgi:hypothetical protein